MTNINDIHGILALISGNTPPHTTAPPHNNTKKLNEIQLKIELSLFEYVLKDPYDLIFEAYWEPDAHKK